MADFKKLADEVGAKAAFGAAKNAARRALDDLTLTDEERALREAERAKEARIRKWKWIAGGVVAVLVFLALLSILAKLWAWFVLLALVAGGAWLAWYYLKPKAKAVQGAAIAQLEAHRSEERAEEDERAAAEAAERASDAAKAAAAAREQAIDEELAALKAKTKPKG